MAALILAAIPGQLIMMLFGGIGELIDIGIAIAFGIFLYKKVFLTKIEADLADAERIADAEDTKGTEILESNGSVLSVIPSEYWYPKATNYILRVIQTGRADSINQALVMFDEQNHRWKVEDANASIVAQQTEQTKALKGIRKSSAVSAGANVVSAVSNIARWF